MASSAKGRKGKLGKNKNRIAAYYNSARFNWNKARRIAHHLRRYGKDPVAVRALKVHLAAMPLHLCRAFGAQYNDVTP